MFIDKKAHHIHNIVLIGSFNPKIFHPIWLLESGLIKEAEAEKADIQICNNDISIFSIEWAQFEITKDKFKISTEQEAYFEFIRDLVEGMFTLLSHTPVKAIGINNLIHIKLYKDEELYEFFNSVSPYSKWESVFNKPEIRNIALIEKKEGSVDGHLRILIEPSVIFKPGIYFDFNDHYQIVPNDQKNYVGCKEAMEVMKINWTNTNSNCIQKVEQIWNLK